MAGRRRALTESVIIPGVVFGAFAGYVYWFPKAFGFKLDGTWGRRAFWCWFIGFHLAFMPLYVVGLMGMTRRLQHYDVLSWQPWLLVAGAGAVVIFAGVVCQISAKPVTTAKNALTKPIALFFGISIGLYSRACTA